MRSRFSAFAVGEPDYLLSTWHPRTRPRSIDLDPARSWTRLDILSTSAGGFLDTDGTVEFIAHYRDGAGGQRGRQHENSRFLRVRRQWFYLDGGAAGR